MTYELFCNSVRGLSHIKQDTPCEDFGIKADCDGYKIFAVADGHGDSNCLRSNIGSKYICKIASEELENFAQKISAKGCEEKLFDMHEAKLIVEGLIQTIVCKWIKHVAEELVQNPLSEEEIQKAPAYAYEYRKGIRTERMYGTTLIAGLQTERYLLLLQQGDGRCAVFDSNGNVSQPIPWDNRCLGTTTTSLCDEDAIQSFRYYIINLTENPVIACIAGTDGVEDSFPSSMDKTHVYYRDILRYACENGVQALETYLIEDLNNLSTNGSADDITISGIIDIERVKPFLDAFAERNRLVNLEDEVTLLVGKVKSIEEGGKLQHLIMKYNEAVKAFEKAEKRYKNLVVVCETMKETISAHEQGVPKSKRLGGSLLKYIKKLILPQDLLLLIKQEYERKCGECESAKEEQLNAAEKKAAAEKEYLPYRERYDSFIQRRDDAIKRLEEIKG